MIEASVARRYARALFGLALEEGRHEKVGEEIEAVVRAIQSSREARAVAFDPASSPQQRRALVEAIATAGGVSPVLADFLRLLADRRRMHYLPAIARACRAMLDQQVGRVRATVTSAQPLGDDQLQRLRDTLARATRRSIVLESRTDPKIIGGVVAQVGATQYDGSLRTQLERLRSELKRGPLGA